MTQESTFDPITFKDTIHREWQAAAPGWRTWCETMETEDGSRGLSRILVDRARLRPGDAVLDVGAGYGEPGLTAARAVSPGGRVVLQDIAGDMLAFARERAAQAGAADVEVDFVECDAEGLALEPDGFDAVISRAALMYLTDVGATLTRLRSACKPHGRFAATVWSSPDRVGFAAPLPIILDAVQLPPPPPDRPGPFALSDPDHLTSLVADAGFAEVETGTVTAVWEFGSPEACTRFIRDVAPPILPDPRLRPGRFHERLGQLPAHRRRRMITSTAAMAPRGGGRHRP